METVHVFTCFYYRSYVKYKECYENYKGGWCLMVDKGLEGIFSTQNKYKIAEEKNSNNGFDNNQIVIGVHRRVSTGRQALEGDSLEMQSELAQNHTQKIGGIVYKYYTEEGLSAKKTPLKKREVMQEIIQDIEDGKINYLIAYRRDRLFRNQAENMWFWSLLAEHDCRIYLTASGETQVNVDELKKAGTTKMMESILAMMAEMESEITSTRVSDVMLSKAQKGEYTGGSTPIGYERNEEGYFIPKQGTVEIVKTIEDLYLQGLGVHSIARWLNGFEVSNLPVLDAPIPKPIEGDRSTVWNHRNITTILFNPFYTGNLSYESKKNTDVDRIIRSADFIEPIRTLERQKQLNALKMKKQEGMKPPRAYNTPFLLTGLLYCEECGERFLTSTSSPKGTDKRFSYYRCSGAKGNYATEVKCKNHGYKKEVLESLVIKITKEKLILFKSEGLVEKFKVRAKANKNSYINKYQELEKNIQKKQKELQNLTKVIVGIDDEDLQQFYLKEQSNMLIEINNMKESLALTTEKSIGEEVDEFDFNEFLDLASTYGENIDIAPMGIKKRLVESLFTNIKVSKEGEVSMQIKEAIAKIIMPTGDDELGEQDEVIIGFGTGGSPPVMLSVFKCGISSRRFMINSIGNAAGSFVCNV